MNSKPEENVNSVLAGICNSLNHFRKENKHCDVELKIEEKKYPCHKVVIAASSKHFDTMFNSSFQEKEARSITLSGDIDPSIFEEVLEFLYIGNIKFTEENVYGLLRTSHYLEIQELENRCCNYISDNPNVEQLLEICEYLFKIGRTDYVEVAVKHVVPKMKFLYQSDVFNHLSEVVVSEILKNGKERNYPNGEFIEATYKWVKHDWEERKCYLRDLMKCIIPSSDYSISLLEQFSEMLSIDNKTFVSLNNIDVFCSTSQGLDKINCNEGSWIWKKKISGKKDFIKITRFQNHYYYLSYSYSAGNYQFWTSGRNDNDVINLSPPSTHSTKYDILINGETLFLYNSESPSHYSDIAIQQYIFDLGTWHSVSSTPQRFYHSYFTSVDKILYLIGGTTNTSMQGEKSKVIQCYDKRCRKWVQKSIDKSFLLNGSVCVYQNEIYIYEEPLVKQGCLHVYNTVAEKFRQIDVIYPFSTPGVMFSSDQEMWYFEKKIQGMTYKYNVLNNDWADICNIPAAIETTSGSININKIEYATFC